MTVIGDIERLVATSLYPLRVPLLIAGVAVLVVVARLARRRGWVGAARAHPGRTAIVLVPLLAVGLPLAWYLGSPLVITTRIDEAPPVAAATAQPSPSAAPIPTPSHAEAAPEITSSPSSAVSTAPATPGFAERRGSFKGADDFHFARGTARLYDTSSGFVVRLEDFSVRNGPDLFVYLSPSARGYAADGNLELGRLKASEGNQNYQLPAGVDPAGFRSVVIWCRQFAVQFGVARFGGG